MSTCFARELVTLTRRVEGDADARRNIEREAHEAWA